MESKVLIVDSEIDMQHLIKIIFKEDINNGKIKFFFAVDGLEAMQILKTEKDISVVLTEINMPGMNGFDLLRELSKSRSLSRAILVTASCDMQNIRAAMNFGAIDFITKPINMHDYKATLYRAIQEYEFLKAATEKENHLKEINIELNIAKSLQESMLPSDFRPFNQQSLEAFAKMIPAKFVGGDFYDLFFLNAEELGFTIGDVSGKNISASIYMAIVKSLFKYLCFNSDNCAQVFNRLDKILSKEINVDMFVTIFYGILNLKTGRLAYCNAGHNPPYIIHAEGRITKLDANLGHFMGASSLFATDFEYPENYVRLEDNDCLFLYTDGVTEAMNPQKEFFSDLRLEQTLRQSYRKPAMEMINDLLEEIRNFSMHHVQTDDITMMALKFLGKG